MLSQRQIDRLVHTGAYRRLSRRILANGRCQDRRIIERLLEPRAVAPAALGLALQRLLELSWGPSVEAQRVVQRLVACQRPDGLFGGESPSDDVRLGDDGDGSDAKGAARGIDASEGAHGPSVDERGDGGGAGSVAATAVSVAGLWRWLERAGESDPPVPHELVDRAQRAVDAAVGALQRSIETSCDERNGAKHFGLIDAVIVLWQLAGIDELDTRLDLDRLAGRLERCARLAELGTLFGQGYSSAA